MAAVVKPIGVIQGARSPAVQDLLREFVARCGAGARVVGLIEDSEADCGAASGRLRSLTDARSYPVFQDLGTGSEGCSLDPGGVVSAGEAVRRDIVAGCDFVVLSKFGKLEAEQRSGLIPAFVAAIEAGVPILTTVSPRFAAGWDSFAAPFYRTLPPDIAVIERWSRAALAAAAAGDLYEIPVET